MADILLLELIAKTLLTVPLVYETNIPVCSVTMMKHIISAFHHSD